MNRAGEAEQYLSRAVAIQEAEFGPDDVSTLPNLWVKFQTAACFFLSFVHADYYAVVIVIRVIPFTHPVTTILDFGIIVIGGSSTPVAIAQ